MSSGVEVPRYGVVHDAPWLEVCFHEAGHALVAKLVGVPVLSVEASANGGGVTRLDWPPLEECDRRQIRARQLICAGGGLGETLGLTLIAHQGDSEAERWRGHVACSSDRDQFERYGQYPGGISPGAAEGQACALLETHLGRLEEVAYALSETGHLSGSEV